MEQITPTDSYPILTELLRKLKDDRQMGLQAFLDHWSAVPCTAFCSETGRILIHEIQNVAAARFQALLGRNEFPDVYLPEERVNRILWDLAHSADRSFRDFLTDLQWLSDFSFSAIFCHRLISVAIFCIQFQLYSYATELLHTLPWLGTFADSVDENRPCPCAYAIEQIKEDRHLFPILNAVKPSVLCDLPGGKETLACTAVRMRRHNVLKYLFAQNFSTEKYALLNQTLLQYGARSGDTALIRFALEELHHRPDCTGLTKQTPLMLAVEQDDPASVSILLAHGADVNATDDNGNTVLRYCKSPVMRQLLLQHSARAQDKVAQVLSKAIRLARNGPMPDKLLEDVIRYSPDTLTHHGKNLAVILAENGRADKLEKLLQHYDLSDQAENLAHAVFYAPIPQNKPVSVLIRLVDVLLDAGIRVKTDTMKILDPFPTLAERPEIFDSVSRETACELFDKVSALGYDPLLELPTGNNLLFLAIQGMNIPLIHYCIDRGLSLQELDATKGAAAVLLTHFPLRQELGFHSIHREVEVWELCRQAGCRINRQNWRGETALHALIRKSWVSPEMVQIALSLGIDPSIRSNNGKTAARLALELGCPSTVIALLDP